MKNLSIVCLFLSTSLILAEKISEETERELLATLLTKYKLPKEKFNLKHASYDSQQIIVYNFESGSNPQIKNNFYEKDTPNIPTLNNAFRKPDYPYFDDTTNTENHYKPKYYFGEDNVEQTPYMFSPNTRNNLNPEFKLKSPAPVVRSSLAPVYRPRPYEPNVAEYRRRPIVIPPPFVPTPLKPEHAYTYKPDAPQYPVPHLPVPPPLPYNRSDLPEAASPVVAAGQVYSYMEGISGPNANTSLNSESKFEPEVRSADVPETRSADVPRVSEDSEDGNLPVWDQNNMAYKSDAPEIRNPPVAYTKPPVAYQPSPMPTTRRPEVKYGPDALPEYPVPFVPFLPPVAYNGPTTRRPELTTPTLQTTTIMPFSTTFLGDVRNKSQTSV